MAGKLRSMISLVGSGLYTLPQAARLVGERPLYVRRWLCGYTWRRNGRQSTSAPLWQTQYEGEEIPGGAVIGFRDLLELRMVSAFARHGVHLSVIRAAIESAAAHFGDAYPLSNRRLLTDGKRIFMHAVEVATKAEKLIDVTRRQFVMPDIIKPSLFEGIDFDGDTGPRRWFPVPKKRDVVLDPEVQFGTPVVANAGVPTDAIFDAWVAERKDAAFVARVFGLRRTQVLAAVDFEQRLAA
jgi:uncharacterized protein (DUF433 family)